MRTCSHVGRFPMMRQVLFATAALWSAWLAACGSSGGSTDGGAPHGMGAPCSCGYDVPPGGDFVCGSAKGPCASPLSCIDGTCTITCPLDGGICPSGYVCRETAHSNLATYCAPVK